MDKVLAQAIIDLEVPFFGANLKNKGDSRSCLFRPRRLLSHAPTLQHIGKEMGKVALERCSSKTLVGVATSGIAFVTAASIYSELPMMYVRKHIEKHLSNSMLAGIEPEDKRVVLVDDLIFAGGSKTEAIETLQELGYTVTDVIVAIDRQLQRKDEGPSLQEKFNVKLHSLITMSEIVEYMKQQNAITDEQIDMLREDYQRFERWDQADFAK